MQSTTRPLVVSFVVAALTLPGCSGGGSTGAARTAPTIANLQLEPRVAYTSNMAVTFTVGFDLFDPNRDVASASFVLRDGAGQLVDQQTLVINATAANARIQGGAAVPLPQLGTFTVELWTTDAAGLLSNSLQTTVDVVAYPWRDVPQDPVARLDAAAVTLDGGIYVLGGSRQDLGLIPGPSTPLVARFDPVSATWTPVAELTVPRRGLAAAVAGGRIYAVGGESTPLQQPLGSLVASVEQYDPAVQLWSPRAAMPTARARIAAATVGDRIYVVGGRGSGGLNDPLATVESYDPVADTWTTEAPLPNRRYGARAAAFGGRLVVAGGRRDQSNCEDRVDVFDPATGSWTTLPQSLCCTWLTVAGGSLHAGNGTEIVASDDPELLSWRGLSSSQRGSDLGSTAAATADSIFVFGWLTAERYTLALELY